MKVTDAPLAGVKIIELDAYGDSRGFFRETFQAERYAEHGIEGPFLQDDHSRSSKNVLRGMHYQLEHAQDKLISVTRGAVLDVVVDIRRSSETFGQWFSVELSDENHRQIWVPKGFAHGFFVLSDIADMHYRCTDTYYPQSAFHIRWDDPDIGIDWPCDEPIVSDKDMKAKRLSEMPEDALFK